jgi:hypothetical protein
MSESDESSHKIERKEIYKCKRCKKTWTKKSNYLRHLQRKNPCKVKTESLNILNIKEIIDAINNKSKPDYSNFDDLFEDMKMLKNEIQKIKEQNVEITFLVEQLQKEHAKSIGKNVDDIFDIKKQKFKKQTISQVLKKKVWDKHFTIKVGQVKCPCCEISDIEQASFACGHIIAESNGGLTEINNLIPICIGCNASMSTQNYNDFKKTLDSEEKNKNNKVAIINSLIVEIEKEQEKTIPIEKVYTCWKCTKKFRDKTVKYSHQLKCNGILKIRKGDTLNKIVLPKNESNNTNNTVNPEETHNHVYNKITIEELQKTIKDQNSIIETQQKIMLRHQNNDTDEKPKKVTKVTKSIQKS